MEIDDPSATPPLDFDLQAYANNYIDHAKIDRLVYIAKNCIGHPLELDALKMAHDEVKKTSNTGLYKQITDQINNRLGPEYTTDSVWIDDTDNRFARLYDQLEDELNSARTLLDKEAMRQSHQSLGNALYDRGVVNDAFRHYVRSRDYITDPSHIMEMCLNVVKCSLEMGQYVHIPSYIQKAENIPKDLIDPTSLAKLKCIQGISDMSSGRYTSAAKTLTDLPFDLGTDFFNDVASGGDIATYGTLCALATMSRREIQSRVIQNVPFWELLDTAPEQIKSLLNDFYTAKYGDTLSSLQSLTPSLILDPYIGVHVKKLMKDIRSKVLVLYTRPFVSLDLRTMADAFHTDVDVLEKEIVELISTKQITARIDSHNKIWHAKSIDLRGEAFHAAITAAEEYIQSTRSLLLRASMIRHDLVQRPASGPERLDRGEGPRGRREGHRNRRERHSLMTLE